MLIYLAGPVDGAEDAATWREEASAELIRVRPHIATYSPPHALSCGAAATQNPDTSRSIININLAALMQADFVIARLDGPSFGTPIECREAPCPVVGFGDIHRMQHSVYQHEFTWLAIAWKEAVEHVLWLIKAEEEELESLHARGDSRCHPW
jgi:hypothetical protein